MATAFKFLSSLPELPQAQEVLSDIRSLRADNANANANDNRDDPYAALRREAPSVGQRGVHSAAFALCGSAYGAMLFAFWAAFGREGYSALVLAVVSVLMLVYFSLILGGLTFSDTPTPGTLRSFRAFLDGPVETATGVISGRAAMVMIAGLPALLAVMALTIGIIARITLAN
jgi:hypothetical protein